ncbi:uncharacterized protein TERG_11928 [Trichophyton rubrum CBS 118892]|uniref:Uncharacterized protein n=1 Tax=Trichophyton rubrum (strain ATCC MYA-4607 / CBS 118892) TaxID=559305 RepID=A0A080WJX0_TRIRC|nr:uncharacterized protein TERG_11928 [Trichophyton rubrum CBS 118892]KFL61037.1 hypothetical protein TERG_11928 [Trichophyton rubrum CBS 118892]
MRAGWRMRKTGFQVRRNSSEKIVWFPGLRTISDPWGTSMVSGASLTSLVLNINLVWLLGSRRMLACSLTTEILPAAFDSVTSFIISSYPLLYMARAWVFSSSVHSSTCLARRPFSPRNMRVSRK